MRADRGYRARQGDQRERCPEETDCRVVYGLDRSATEFDRPEERFSQERTGLEVFLGAPWDTQRALGLVALTGLPIMATRRRSRERQTAASESTSRGRTESPGNEQHAASGHDRCGRGAERRDDGD